MPDRKLTADIRSYSPAHLKKGNYASWSLDMEKGSLMYRSKGVSTPWRRVSLKGRGLDSIHILFFQVLHLETQPRWIKGPLRCSFLFLFGIFKSPDDTGIVKNETHVTRAFNISWSVCKNNCLSAAWRRRNEREEAWLRGLQLLSTQR